MGGPPPRPSPRGGREVLFFMSGESGLSPTYGACAQVVGWNATLRGFGDWTADMWWAWRVAPHPGPPHEGEGGAYFSEVGRVGLKPDLRGLRADGGGKPHPTRVWGLDIGYVVGVAGGPPPRPSPRGGGGGGRHFLMSGESGLSPTYGACAQVVGGNATLRGFGDWTSAELSVRVPPPCPPHEGGGSVWRLGSGWE
jgi:hypothetical protein